MTNCHFEFQNFQTVHLNCIFHSFRDTITFLCVHKIIKLSRKRFILPFCTTKYYFLESYVTAKAHLQTIQHRNQQLVIVSTSHSLHHRCNLCTNGASQARSEVRGPWPLPARQNSKTLVKMTLFRKFFSASIYFVHFFQVCPTPNSRQRKISIL